ncbi:DUF2069 domain-containing protein [Halomonas sp. ML-15]|uniref:DUF2069 domain-containing protein n=1 Tax=Halomonas sp. ML-15 TaxID=2773305 RepID=UPI0017461082|nr:DUF2069 domain-containing protein [Halomonas sp. ML-15]MBD3894385.1 DUF2069 domain-containing protein [Halomonas sp. ML-15]
MRQMLERWEAQHGLDALTARARRAVLTSYVVLLLLLVYSGIAIHSIEEGGWIPILVRGLPLVLFLPSIIGQRPRGHAWLAFVSLLYFMQGVMVATLPGQGLFGMLEALTAMALFAASTCYARFRSRQMRQQG